MRRFRTRNARSPLVFASSDTDKDSMEHDQVEKYRTMLADDLNLTQGRTMYSQAEVRDLLLDLWNELTADDKVLAPV